MGAWATSLPGCLPGPGRGRDAAVRALARRGGAAGRPPSGQSRTDHAGSGCLGDSNGGTSYGWKAPEKDATVSKPISFGFNVAAISTIRPTLAEGAKLPTVIWLHGYSCSLGYMWVYHSDLHPILALVRAGYAVLAYDQTGYGSRQMETGPFYDRYPHWSQMGRMVEDARAAMDALSKDSLVDPSRIYLFGYSIGATAGLYAAALDPRIKGMVSISGFTPMRTDAAERGDGGIARYSSERGLMPRLGFFVGHEAQIPYDFHEVLGAIAPRPVAGRAARAGSGCEPRRRAQRCRRGQEDLCAIRRRRQAGTERALGLQPAAGKNPGRNHSLDAWQVSIGLQTNCFCGRARRQF